MADSLRKQIRLALAERLSAIQQTNGYSSDAGLQVVQGRGRSGPDEKIPTLVISFGESTITEEIGGNAVILPFEVAGVVDEEQADPLVIEDLLADLLRAVFLDGDRKLGGLVLTVKHTGDAIIEREDGGLAIGCRLMGSIEYTERYGDPEVEASE